MTGQQLARARVLIELGRWDEALAALGHAAPSGEDLADVLCMRAQCLLGLARPTEALAAAERALAAAPDEEWPHRLVSIAAAALGRSRQSLRAAREAARLEPVSPLTLHTLALAEMAAGNKAAAEAAAAAALAADPHAPLAHETVARVALRTGRLDMAEAAARRALALAPQDSNLQSLLADVLERRGHPDEVRALRVSAVRSQPQARSHRRDLVRTAAPVALAGGVIIKIIALQGAFRLFRLMWNASYVRAVVVFHVLIAAIWAVKAWRRRRAGRDLPAGFYAGLRPERRQSDLRWLRASGVIMVLLSAAHLIFSRDRGLAWPAVELGVGVAELTLAALMFRRLAARFGVTADFKPPLVLLRMMIDGVLTRAAGVARADRLSGLTRDGEPTLAERIPFALASLAWPVLAGAVTLLVARAFTAAAVAAVIVAAVAGALRDGRLRQLGTDAGYRVVVDEQAGTVPGAARLAARSVLRLVLAPLLVAQLVVGRARPMRCPHDHLTATVVVRMRSALDGVETTTALP